MPPRPTPRDLGSLFDIVEAAELIMTRLEHVQPAALASDLALRDAVLYRFVVIGEAARRLSDEVKAMLPLPWPRITGMRNVLVHNYDEVDFDAVCRTSRDSLPELVRVIRPFLQQHPPE